MKIVLAADGFVSATHDDSQDISGVSDYVGCLVLSVPNGTAVEVGQVWLVTVAEAQAARVAEAAAACDAILAPLAARFGAYERDTWPAQLAEARALLADPALATPPQAGQVDAIPTIRTITAVTGEDLGAFAAAVVKNNDDWLRLTAHVAGQRQVFVARLKDCATVADVLAVPLAIGLPGVGP
ncbi:hypothetical protein [Solidesulfovibrio sp.]|uniref:hypothetical protein n=1 Tax=Solidesulfovibrio sp. TaxID=2910990 RepID=UPI002B201DA9|nr:hypothetical protein [Solidesulfovibrio sp.]MEA4857281.1 hypothetical protein [Solidesulfovibrio sp.]